VEGAECHRLDRALHAWKRRHHDGNRVRGVCLDVSQDRQSIPVRQVLIQQGEIDLGRQPLVRLSD
jgi:hypothetical protein